MIEGAYVDEYDGIDGRVFLRRVYFARREDAQAFAGPEPGTEGRQLVHATRRGPVPILVAQSIDEVRDVMLRTVEDRALAKLDPEERRALVAMFARQAKALPDTAAGSALGNASVLPQ
jgi:hypothetical protein